MDVIEISGLSKTYRGKKRTVVQALQGLNLRIGQGEVFGFLGPNGAGKSTTIKILTGQVRPTNGSAGLFGVPAGTPVARKRMGYLPENPSLYDFMTAREYLRFVGRAFRMSAKQIESESQRVLELMRLSDAAKRPIRGFSKGMVQRLGLAQTMLHDPDLYLLDEPMSGLDPVGRALVKEIILDLKRRGKTVFFSTHITSDVETLCDRVGVIAQGRLRADDCVADVLGGAMEAYRLSVRSSDGVISQLEVAHTDLKKQLEELVGGGALIEKIDPVRQSLETYFLDIIAADNPPDEKTV